MKILALDPGTEKTGWVIWDGAGVFDKGTEENPEILALIAQTACDRNLKCVIEQMSCYGARVGRETFEAIHWSGRFYQAWAEYCYGLPDRIERREVKKHLCGSATANDAAIWAVLRDRFGDPGTKKNPNPALYGVTSHQRAALALAVTWYDLQEAKDA